MVGRPGNEATSPICKLHAGRIDGRRRRKDTIISLSQGGGERKGTTRTIVKGGEEKEGKGQGGRHNHQARVQVWRGEKKKRKM